MTLGVSSLRRGVSCGLWCLVVWEESGSPPIHFSVPCSAYELHRPKWVLRPEWGSPSFFPLLVLVCSLIPGILVF